MERMKVEQVAPEIYKALFALHQAAEKSGIEKGLMHLVKLRASQLNSCAYCMATHSREAIRDGEHPDRVALLSGWRETDLFTPREQAALAWTEVVTALSAGDVSNALELGFRLNIKTENTKFNGFMNILLTFANTRKNDAVNFAACGDNTFEFA